MTLGTTPLTLFHVALSLVGIAAGFVVMAGMLQARRLPRWTAIFLATTLATTVTGFLFPINGFTPALGVGIVSLLVFAVVLPALYVFRLAGHWRWVYVVGAVFVQYLDVFVLVVQLFDKVPALHAIAPTQASPAFAAAQGLVLIAFIVFGVLAVRRFHPGRAIAPMPAATPAI
jgi:hypothetical protein